MSAKQNVIAFVNQKFHAYPVVRDALAQTVSACADNGELATLWTAYEQYRPEIVFTNDPQAESGAFYDYGSNKITVKPEGVPLDFADMFLFESFNCAHRDEYNALDRTFNTKWPPMFFKDYGEKKSDIEGRATFQYLTLLREIQQSTPAWSLPYQALRTLKDNDGIAHSSQLVARMHWTPHDPKGTGDMRFPSPLHYAFQRVLTLGKLNAAPRIKYVITKAAGGDPSGGFYSTVDPDKSFWNWWVQQWPHLRQDARPTALITVFEEANKVFQGKPNFHWRRIELADYQFDTAMEMEARRLCKHSSLGQAPGRTVAVGAQIPAFVATRH